MKKNRLYMILFVFVMFFCVNIGEGSALNEKGTGGVSGTLYSYGIKCFYQGNLSGVANYGGSTGSTCGSDNSTTTPVVYGIDYYCFNGSMSSDGSTVANCKRFGAWGHGRAAHINGSDVKKVGISNYDSFFNSQNIPNNTYSYFGASKDKGVKKCPSSIYVDGDLMINASQLMGSGEYPLGKMSFTRNGKKLTLLSGKTYRYKKGNGGNLENDVLDIISDFKEVTRCGDTYYDTTHGSVGIKVEKNTNEKLVDSIKKWAEEQKDLQKNPNIEIGVDDKLDCHQVLGDAFAEVLAAVFTITCVIGVVLLIITLVFDFIKAIASNENDGLLDAFKKAKTRIIATIILLMLPVFINFVIDFLNNNLIVEDGNVKIGNVSECKIVKN